MNTLFVLAFSLTLAWTNAPETQSLSTINANHSIVIDDKTAEAVAERVFEAYSKKDLQSFVSYFSNDVEVSLFNDKTLYKGKTELEKNYAYFFKVNPNFRTEFISRKVTNNHVVEEFILERVKGKGQKITVIYEINNGLVQKMCFL
jgi:hypothetical protein